MVNGWSWKHFLFATHMLLGSAAKIVEVLLRRFVEVLLCRLQKSQYLGFNEFAINELPIFSAPYRRVFN